jgi:beta-lactamase class C
MKQDTRSGRWLRHIARCLAAAALMAFGAPAQASDADRAHVERIIGEAIRPVMAEHAIPGMAVAVTVRGQRHVFHYGVASRESGRPVTDATLFEIGSVSKTMTALLAAYAQASGRLSLSDPASRHLPALAGSRLDRVSLLDLGTYTAGGLPLQFPAGVRDEAGMVAYFRGWRPAYEPGTHRVYSNPSLGLFGHLAARAMGEPFTALMEGRLFPALGLSRAYIRVPRERMDDYAQGYNRENRPTRVSPGMFDAEAYGVKTTASDLIRFVEANMDGSVRDERLKQAIRATQAAHDRVGPMMQGLGWEMLSEPVDLAALVATTSLDFALKPARVERLDPPLPPRPDLWLHKTGSTAGFGAYAAFVPARNVGIVMLANRAYPNAARVTAAHRILTALGRPQ